MAIKDWKKTGESVDRMTWKSRNDGTMLSINKAEIFPYKWNVVIVRGTKIIANEDHRRSKSGALKFARSWMKHWKGAGGALEK